MSSLLSTATVAAVGLTCKAFLNSGMCSITVRGLPTLVAALEHSDTSRKNGQGIVTVSNHISTLDDPLAWGVLPIRYYCNPKTTRWALGASDIIFTNSLFSTFFRLGQTLETCRGQGIFQPAVDSAIDKLNEGGWVHLYGEGKVNQPSTYQTDQFGRASLPRFKWGVGRILMEAEIPPVIIPMWLTGFDRLMPEGRSFHYKYLPRMGAQLSITFGDPIPPHTLLDALSRIKRDVMDSGNDAPIDSWPADSAVHKPRIRKQVTALVQRSVEALGRSVSGDRLFDPL
ncbi:acyltransferase-domain-containing protein [Cyathus striatus]|nr:acyltransferase-domain-containing protein [Cyathus striatus]